MDTLPNIQTTPPVPQNSFLKTTRGKIIILVSGIILLAIASYTLSYLNIFPFSKKPAINQSQIPVTVKKLALSCPVAKELCSTAQTIQYNNKPALSLNLPTKTSISSVAPVVDLLTFNIGGKETLKNKIIKQTTIISNNCYTISYILPKEATIKKVDLLPLEKDEIIATASGSLILQIQKNPLDPKTSGQPDFKRCSTTNNQAGEFEPITTSLFQ